MSPLDWGLGHATRCIPVIRHLLGCGCRVIIISSGRSLSLLQKEFPDITTYNVEAYNIEYQRKGNFVLKIALQLWKVFIGIRNEHKQLRRIIDIENPDLIISDNRYGMYSAKIKSIFITHQIMVKIPNLHFLEPVVKWWLYSRHKKFDTLWIPDMENTPNLAGDLSHSGKLIPDSTYIGILTRFLPAEKPGVVSNQILIILSGPEPQRSIFEDMILEQIAALPFQFIVVQGKSEVKENFQLAPHIQLISYANADVLYQMACASEIIISRGGYSTLMDFSQLNKHCIFIPTPGQTEQEYLVKQLADSGQVVYAKQEECNIAALISAVKEKNIRFYIPTDINYFTEIINTELQTLH